MLIEWTTHATYLERLELEIMALPPNDRNRLLSLYQHSLLKLSLLNLDPLLPIVKHLYPELGRPAKNQCELIRALVLMIDNKTQSITTFARSTTADPLFRILCGFKKNEVPGLASYYDLLERLWLSSRKHNRFVLRKFRRKPSKRLKPNKKLPNRKPGVVKRLVSAMRSGKLPDIRPERVLQAILKYAVVDTSAQLGILGKLESFTVAVDGSPYYAGSSPYGVRVCDCKAKGIHMCDCKRRYSDPDASWGWDSYRERYFYGNTLFSVTASDSHSDLPIYLQMAQASRHDGVSTVFALRNVLADYPEFCIRNLLADGAMDDYSLYELLKEKSIIPFIPLPENTKFPTLEHYPEIDSFDDKGRPVCPAGHLWAHWGYDKTKHRHKYRCPFSAKNEACPNSMSCTCKSKTKYGPSFYLKASEDLRLYPPVLRSSDAFKQVFKRRSSVERTFKRLFEDYQIEAYRSRSRGIRFALAIFAGINMHLDAWVKHFNLHAIDRFPKLAAV